VSTIARNGSQKPQAPVGKPSNNNLSGKQESQSHFSFTYRLSLANINFSRIKRKAEKDLQPTVTDLFLRP